MAIVNGVTTKSASLVWKSPDGARELYEVVLDYQGQELKAKTYSTTLINVGWEGDVLVEERQGKQGLETFVKQAPKEDSSYGGGHGGQASHSSSQPSKSGYVPKDEKAIQAMWAIREANTYFDLTSLDMAAVESLAIEMMYMVDRVKASQSPEPTTDAPAVPDVVVEDIDDPLDLSLMDEVLGGKPAVAETPWGKATATPPAS